MKICGGQLSALHISAFCDIRLCSQRAKGQRAERETSISSKYSARFLLCSAQISHELNTMFQLHWPAREKKSNKTILNKIQVFGSIPSHFCMFHQIISSSNLYARLAQQVTICLRTPDPQGPQNPQAHRVSLCYLQCLNVEVECSFLTLKTTVCGLSLSAKIAQKLDQKGPATDLSPRGLLIWPYLYVSWQLS